MNNKLVKVILANDQVFPQTVAEAVLINGDQVTTLDKVLPKKIEQIITPDNSGGKKDGSAYRRPVRYAASAGITLMATRCKYKISEKTGSRK